MSSTSMQTKPEPRVPPTDRSEKNITINVEGKSHQIVIHRDETTAQVLARLNLKDYELSMGPSNPLKNNLLNSGDVVFDNVNENQGLTAIPPVKHNPNQPVKR